MRLHKNARPERCCKRGTTDAACYPKLEVGQHGEGVVIATDGNVIVHLPVECEGGDDSGLLPMEALTTARAHTPKEGDTAGQMYLQCGARIHVPEAGQDNDRPAVTGSLFSDHDFPVPKRGQVEVSFDAHLLARVAQAMGTKRVTLSFNRDRTLADPLRVDPCGESWVPGACGAIMPTSESEDENDA